MSASLLKARVAGCVFRLLTRSIASLPARVGYGLADFATGLHWLGFPARRRAALANLAVLLPRSSRRARARIARHMMRSHNRMLYEFFRLPHVPREQLLASVEVVGKEHLDGVLERGRGGIITTPHVGNWDLAGAMLAHVGYVLYAVADVQVKRWFSSAVNDARTRLSVTTIRPAQGFRKLLRALEENCLVALMVDGHVFGRGVTVEWFGRPTPFPQGPSVLARRTGALVIPAYCQRLRPGRFRVVVERPLDPASFATTAELHQAVAAAAERQVRTHLEQWCIFRPLWTTPPVRGAASSVGEGRQVAA